MLVATRNYRVDIIDIDTFISKAPEIGEVLGLCHV